MLPLQKEKKDHFYTKGFLFAAEHINTTFLKAAPFLTVIYLT
jgi:hypothetical protein